MEVDLGETAEKTRKVINAARGGTLLVDEAYQLSLPDNARDFGREAIETIMGSIEGSDNTLDDRPAYIFAGYPHEMQRLLEANSGLRHRIPDTFNFDDYTLSELFEIFMVMASKSGFVAEVEEKEAEEQMAATFTAEFCAKYNAAISRELLAESKANVNNCIFIGISSGPMSEAAMKREVMLITNDDFVAACKKVHEKTA